MQQQRTGDIVRHSCKIAIIKKYSVMGVPNCCANMLGKKFSAVYFALQMALSRYAWRSARPMKIVRRRSECDASRLALQPARRANDRRISSSKIAMGSRDGVTGLYKREYAPLSKM
jgi:hypothetical protein